MSTSSDAGNEADESNPYSVYAAVAFVLVYTAVVVAIICRRQLCRHSDALTPCEISLYSVACFPCILIYTLQKLLCERERSDDGSISVVRVHPAYPPYPLYSPYPSRSPYPPQPLALVAHPFEVTVSRSVSETETTGGDT